MAVSGLRQATLDRREFCVALDQYTP